VNLEERLVDAFGKEHPRDVARRIEGAQPEQTAGLLAGVSLLTAASVVAHTSPLAVTTALEHLPPGRASALLAELDPRSIARLLLRCDQPARQKLLASLSRSVAEPVERLLAYPNESVGSRMDPRAPAVPESRTVVDAITAVRAAPGSALYYLYVTDESQRLIGVLNLRELMSASGSKQLSEIMVRDPERARAMDSIETLVRHPAWRKVHALPVVDESNCLVGAVRYSTFRALEAEVGKSLSGRNPSRTANALAELLWLGASAALRTAETALVGARPASEDGS
jgi:Mg/Co/Ni transporter MgtE